jgi:hypothetical protein
VGGFRAEARGLGASFGCGLWHGVFGAGVVDVDLPNLCVRLAEGGGTGRPPLEPEYSGIPADRLEMMRADDGSPIYYGTAAAYDAALEGLSRVKRRYGVDSRQWREAVQAVAGVLGPSYAGPTLEQYESGARNAHALTRTGRHQREQNGERVSEVWDSCFLLPPLESKGRPRE